MMMAIAGKVITGLSMIPQDQVGWVFAGFSQWCDLSTIRSSNAHHVRLLTLCHQYHNDQLCWRGLTIGYFVT